MTKRVHLISPHYNLLLSPAVLGRKKNYSIVEQCSGRGQNLVWLNERSRDEKAWVREKTPMKKGCFIFKRLQLVLLDMQKLQQRKKHFPTFFCIMTELAKVFA